MRVKFFTMVKDEVDIVEDWIKYHGNMFGYKNLYIIDNNSTDGTFELIQSYKNRGINTFRENDYRLKGKYMTDLIHNESLGEYDIAFPIDIDEFAVFFDKHENRLVPEHTFNYMKSLPPGEPVYKAEYIQTLIDSNDTGGYDRATVQAHYGIYDERKSSAKTFFNKHLWSDNIDHGNHYYTEDYYMTNVVLVHYHQRNFEQMKKKVINNLQGLGHNYTDLHILKELSSNNELEGNHHIKNMINIMEDTHNMYSKIVPGQCVNLTSFCDWISVL